MLIYSTHHCNNIFVGETLWVLLSFYYNYAYDLPVTIHNLKHKTVLPQKPCGILTVLSGELAI